MANWRDPQPKDIEIPSERGELDELRRKILADETAGGNPQSKELPQADGDAKPPHWPLILAIGVILALISGLAGGVLEYKLRETEVSEYRTRLSRLEATVKKLSARLEELELYFHER